MSFPYFGESHKKFPEKFTGIRILALNTETFSYEILYFTAKTMPKIEAKYYPGKYREYLAKSEVTIYIDGEKQCIIDFSNKCGGLLTYDPEAGTNTCLFYLHILDSLTKYKNVEIIYENYDSHILRFYNKSNAVERIIIFRLKDYPVLDYADGYYKDNIMYIEKRFANTGSLYKVTSSGFRFISHDDLILPVDKMKDLIVEGNLRSKGILH